VKPTGLRSARAEALATELERRLGGDAAKRRASEDVCRALRIRQDGHPKQRASLRTDAPQVAINAGRRAGKTSEGNHEDLACAIERPGFRGIYCNSTRQQALNLAWRSDTFDGWIDLLTRHGRRDPSDATCWHIGGVTAKVSESHLTVSFSNGSRLEVFSADTPKDLDKFRGRAPSRVRVDEVQKWIDLQRFVRAVVGPAMKDKRGQVVLQGTPGDDPAGFWYEVTKPASEGERLPGWEVHEYTALDNPYFGATEDQRFERVIRPELDDKGMSLDDPDVQREWFARWTNAGTRHVYAVHSAPGKLTYAPMRASGAWTKHASTILGGMTDEALAALEPGWYDHAASVLDLPSGPKRRQWSFGVGLDFGTDPDPFAIVVDAFSPDAPDIYEMFSWKRTGLVPDDWRCIVELVVAQLEGGCCALVGDPAGVKGELMAWRERMGIPIADADKHNKEVWISSYNGDLRRGHRHYREGSPLLHEHRHLVWLPHLPGQKRKVHKHRQLADGSTPGDHCADGSLYLARHLATYTYRKPPERPTALDRDEIAAERAAEVHSRRRIAEGRGVLDHDDDDGWGEPGRFH